MPNEWISVKDRLPTEEEYITVWSDGTETYSRILIAFKTDTIEYEIGCYDGYKWMNEWCNRSISDVIAWKRFVPYIPEPAKEGYAAANILDEIPAADVVEVVHGEWLPVTYTHFGAKRYECSVCRDDEFWEKRYIEIKEKYCPNCGAKMDAERKCEDD